MFSQNLRGAALAIAMAFPSVAAFGSYVGAPTTTVGCTPQARADAKAAIDEGLSAADIACLLAPMIDPDLPEVAMDACHLAPKFRPIVDQILSQKAAAARAGACAPDSGK